MVGVPGIEPGTSSMSTRSPYLTSPNAVYQAQIQTPKFSGGFAMFGGSHGSSF